LRDIAKMGLFLMLVCAVSAAALAYTHQATAPTISEYQEEEQREGLREVLPQAESSMKWTSCTAAWPVENRWEWYSRYLRTATPAR